MNGEKSSRPSSRSGSSKKSKSSSSSSSSSSGEKKKKKKKAAPPPEEDDGYGEESQPPPRTSTVNPKDVPWENTAATTAMWELIDRADMQVHVQYGQCCDLHG